MMRKKPSPTSGACVCTSHLITICSGHHDLITIRLGFITTSSRTRLSFYGLASRTRHIISFRGRSRVRRAARACAPATSSRSAQGHHGLDQGHGCLITGCFRDTTVLLWAVSQTRHVVTFRERICARRAARASSHYPPERDQIAFFRHLICNATRRNPAGTSSRFDERAQSGSRV